MFDLPNRAAEQRQGAILDRQQRLFERSLIPVLRREFRRFARDVGERFSKSPTRDVIEQALPEHQANIRAILEVTYQRVMEHFGRLTIEAASSKSLRGYEQKSVIGRLTSTIRDWVFGLSLSKSKLIANTSAEDFNAVLNKAPVVEEVAPEVLARDLYRRGFNRAPTIAQTEVGGAASQSQLAVAESINVQVIKIWIDMDDAKVRPAHRNVRPVPVNEAFNVGGERLQFPRDPAGSPGNIINCRCQLGFQTQGGI